MQLPLPVTLPTDETFDSFVLGGNSEIVAMLKNVSAHDDWRSCSYLQNLQGLQLPLITLLGGEGIGKSHLLFGLCHQLSEQNVSYLYLNLNDHQDWSLAIFDGLENVSVICLDNIHAIAGKGDWEEALFDLFNRVIEQPGALIICSSHIGPASPLFLLPDLKSRLAWGVIYHIHSLDDEAKKEAVRLRAQQRGLKLSEHALQFLLTHSERDLRSLLALLARLDTRSLQEKRRLSVAMVKRELCL